METVKMVQKQIRKNKNPHIAISADNYNILKNLGKKGQTFDEILTSILAKTPGVYKIHATTEE